MLGGVADERDDDCADEEVRHPEIASRRRERPNEQFTDDGDRNVPIGRDGSTTTPSNARPRLRVLTVEQVAELRNVLRSHADRQQTPSDRHRCDLSHAQLRLRHLR
jgi:hypothetical protein